MRVVAIGAVQLDQNRIRERRGRCERVEIRKVRGLLPSAIGSEQVNRRRRLAGFALEHFSSVRFKVFGRAGETGEAKCAGRTVGWTEGLVALVSDARCNNTGQGGPPNAAAIRDAKSIVEIAVRFLLQKNTRGI